MTKTEHYNLKKPGPNDPLSQADFNENADLIDAALAALNTAVANGVKLQTGSYSGKGVYGSGNPNTLNLNFTPKFLMVWGPYSHIMVGITGKNFSVRYDYLSWECTTTWSGATVKWYYDSSAQSQMNESGKTYYYLALG